MVVQLVKQWLKCTSKISKIHHPATVGAGFAANVNFNAKGMTMHARTLMPFWHIGKVVGGLNLKYAKYVHHTIVVRFRQEMPIDDSETRLYVQP